MKTQIKNALNEKDIDILNNVIIAGKTYKINELYSIFSVKSLMLANKEELYKYWQLAVETGVRQFIAAVDYVFNVKFSRYE